MIEFRCLNKKMLEEFVNSGEFETFDFLPITRHRAWSQIRNQKASDEDVLLTLVFFDGKLAGYLGSLPDELQVGEQRIKFAWLSTLFVHENFRGKRIAQQLLDLVFEKYAGKIAMTEFTPEAENLYNKTQKFDYITPMIGKRFYFKSQMAEIIPRKKPGMSFLKPFLMMGDFLLNFFISFKSGLRNSKNVDFQLLDFADDEIKIFLEDFAKNRSVEELDCILKNPWILEGNQPDQRYVFSSYAKEFQYFWLKVFGENKKLETCALLQLRDGHLKIPYLFSKDHIELFVHSLQRFIDEKNVKALTSYQTSLNAELIQKSFGKLYQKDLERRYLFHKDLLKALPADFEPHFQDGDGDPVFT